MTRAFYDVIVVGTCRASLLCGALLAKRGFRVLHLGHGEPPDSYEVEDMVLPRAPYTFLAAHSPAARRVLAELALHQTFRRRATAPDPILQVVLPGHRVDMVRDAAALEREVEREFPEVKRPVEDFYRSALRASAELDGLVERDVTWPPQSFLERREFARAAAHQPFDRDGDLPDLLGEFPEEHAFRHIVHGPLRFADGMDPDHPSQLRIARLTAAWLRGSASVDGGDAAFRRMILDRIGAQGGDMRLSDRADRILLKRNQVVGVRLAGSGETVGASFIVSGTDLTSMLRLLPDRAPFEELFERIGEPQLRYFRLTVNVVVAAEGVPVGMAQNVFVVRDPRRRLAGDNLLRIEVHPPDAQGRRLLCTEVLVPRSAVEDMAGFVEAIRDRVVAALGDVVPFLERHVLLVDSPHDGRDIEHRALGQKAEPPEPWTRGPATMERVHGYPVPSALGVCALPVRTPIRRLLMCNGQVAPGLGQEGEFLAAWSAAKVISRADRKKERMRRGLFTKVEI